MPQHDFKPGDRVRFVNPFEFDETRGLYIGQLGSVVEYDRNQVTVEFDDFDKGHDGNIGDHAASRWFATFSHLEPAP